MDVSVCPRACVHGQGRYDVDHAGRREGRSRRLPLAVRRFIEAEAEFLFVAPEDVLEVARRAGGTSYDCPGADYTHRDGKCSFEVLVETHSLTDPALRHLARIVHGADIPADLTIAPEAAGLQAIAQDKTGTLTKGEPEATDVIPLDASTPGALLALASAVEAQSEHPLACAVVDGQPVFIGSPRLFAEIGPGVAASPVVSSLEAPGKTVMLVGTPQGPLGVVALNGMRLLALKPASSQQSAKH
jgi:hypothetical protein